MADLAEFNNLLVQLQDRFITKDEETGTLHPIEADLLPSEDQVFELDLHKREVVLPPQYNYDHLFLSVQWEHLAEVIFFKTPRYFDDMDLMHTTCIIQYINADGDAGLYWVPFYSCVNETDPEDETAITPMLYIPWGIGGLATVSPGMVKFCIRFYRVEEPLIDDSTEEATPNDAKFLYNLTTKPQEGEVLHGMDLTETDLAQYKLSADIAYQIYQDLYRQTADLRGGLEELDEIIDEKIEQAKAETAIYWMDV